MTRTGKILSFFIAITFILYAPAFTQTKIQVITRTISRSFICKPGCIFEVKGEKANIHVKKSSDNNIKVNLQLISKNSSVQQAEKDLKYCDYRITESNDAIMVSNLFSSKNQFKEISSNLSAKYEIEVPENIIVKLKNIYGDIDLKSISDNINIDMDFCQLKLSNIYGNLFVISNYSDIEGQDIGAVTNVQAQKGDIVFTNTRSLLKIKDQYGSISLDNINASVNLDAEMTAINVTLDNPAIYSLDFAVKEGEIITPEKFCKTVVSNQGQKKFIYTGGKISIKVTTTYNSITLKTK